MAMFSPDGASPYPSDPNDELKFRAIQERDKHPEEFVFIKDWLNHLHFPYVAEVTTDFDKNISIFNTPFKSIEANNLKLSDFGDLENGVKNFFNLYGKAIGCSSPLMQWSSDAQPLIALERKPAPPPQTPSPLPPPTTDVQPTVEEPETTPVSYDDIVAGITGGAPAEECNWSYNFSSNIMLTYEEVANLCINQAKQSLVSAQIRNNEVEKITNERRNELITDINKYFELSEIAAIYQDNNTKLEKMTIDELELLQQQCVDKFDTLKTKELIKNGLEVLEIAYAAWFPNGIPLGKSRRWTLDKGMLNEMTSSLFDQRKVSGHAFRRILDRHPIHLPDSVTVLIDLGKIALKNSHIKKVDQKNDKPTTDAKIEELDNSYDDEYSYEEEEIKSVDFAN